jgi:hypothetical protein
LCLAWFTCCGYGAPRLIGWQTGRLSRLQGGFQRSRPTTWASNHEKESRVLRFVGEESPLPVPILTESRDPGSEASIQDIRSQMNELTALDPRAGAFPSWGCRRCRVWVLPVRGSVWIPRCDGRLDDRNAHPCASLPEESWRGALTSWAECETGSAEMVLYVGSVCRAHLRTGAGVVQQGSGFVLL